jgi:hypothetical protein
MLRVLILVLALVLTNCPGPTGKVDPFLTARSIVTGAQTSLTFADGIFAQWTLRQSDAVKVKTATEKYTYLKLLVSDGLQVAYQGIAVAEQAKTDPDTIKIMDKAEEAWKELRTFLSDLTPAPAAIPQPTSQPVAFSVKIKTPAQVQFSVASLPESLLLKK